MQTGPERPYSSGLSRERRWLLFVGLSYALLVLLAYRSSSPSFGGDAPDYVDISQYPLFSFRFFTRRPFVVPLIFKMLGGNPYAIVPFQVGLHIAAWLALALATCSHMRDRAARWTAFMGVLLLSLSIQVLCWNYMVLSESLSNSLTVLLIATVVSLPVLGQTMGKEVRTPSWGQLVGLLSLAALWSLTRDTNAYSLLLLSAMGAAALLWRPYRRRISLAKGVVLVAALAGIYTVQTWLTAHTDRQAWSYSMTDVICDRVLTDPPVTEYFRHAGMPVTPIVQGFAGRHNAYMGNVLDSRPDPTLRDLKFEVWVQEHAVGTYARFLATHPMKALKWLWALRENLLSPNVLTKSEVGPFLIVYQRVAGRRQLVKPLCSRGTIPGETAYTQALSGFFFPVFPWFWLLAAAVGLAPLLAWIGDRRPILLMPPLLVVISFAQACIVGLADTGEVDRHAVNLAITMRIAFWLAVFMGLDAFLVSGLRQRFHLSRRKISL